MDYESWCALSDDELARRDIAEVNLTAARGLPGAVDLDIAAYLQKLDAWAKLVNFGIERMWMRRSQSEYSDFTDNQFRILVMVTVLQRNLGVRYNMQCLEGEYDARDARNHFIHGPLDGHGGTCASLPILYLAIGRRLGFPLFLCEAKEHLFVRWEGHGDRFNIEATSLGFTPYDDAHFRTRPRPLNAAEIERCPNFLRNMTRREELACCISQRAMVWFDNLNLPQAIKAMSFARQLSPIYEGAWNGMSMAYLIVSRMRRFDRGASYETLIELAAPQPRTPIEAWAICEAKRQLLRQVTIRTPKRDQTHEQVFAAISEKEPVNV